jgi:SAM-dependent methyltransferase
MGRRGLGGVVALAAALVAMAVAGCRAPGSAFRGPDILFVATPDAVATEMLRLAGTTSRDVVYDLGSGDGRLVIAAARDFGARGVGVEIDADLVQSSREAAAMAGVGDRTRFLWQDLFVTDLGDATVVTLYLGEAVNRRLRPVLLGQLRPGTRVVSHDFGMGDWPPDRTVRARGPDREHRLHLWTIPAAAGGTWRTRLGDIDAGLRLQQRFQRLTGALAAAGDGGPVTGVVEGDRVRLAWGAWSLEGRIDGDRITGVATPAGRAPVPWEATRTAGDRGP